MRKLDPENIWSDFEQLAYIHTVYSVINSSILRFTSAEKMYLEDAYNRVVVNNNVLPQRQWNIILKMYKKLCDYKG